MDERPLPLVLTVNLKETLPAEFGLQVKRYIRDEFHEEPSNYSDEIRALERLRTSASAPTRDYSGCSLLRRYYAQLQYLQSRFPMLEGGAAAVSFSWTDALSEKSCTSADIRHEQASILFNLGALHNQLGGHDSRRTEEGTRVACTHFQCAAGAFDYLKEHFPEATTADMNSDILVLFTSIMLGQAQECLLDKSVKDKRNPGVVAKISLQIAEYFQTAVDMLAYPKMASTMGSKRLKSWTKTLTAKVAYYGGLARFFMAENCEENRKYGEKVAWLQVANERMGEAMKQVKSGDDTTRDAVKYASEIITQRLDKAKKDNQKVYHELVPKADVLPAIVGVSLVKAMPFNPTDPSVAGVDIFAKLVPIRAHEKASVYSEEKAVLLRKVRADIDSYNSDLDRFMHSLDLDEVVGKQSGDHGQRRAAVCLPDDLQEIASNMRARAHDIAGIRKSVQDVEELSTRVQENLEHVRRTVEEEERLGGEFACKYDIQPSPASVTQLGDIKAQLEADFKVFEKGSAASSNLVDMYSTHHEALRLLSSPLDELVASLPVVSVGDLPVDEEVVRRLRQVWAKVDEMRKQRGMLWERLKEQVNKDDITQKLVVHETGEDSALFTRELQKHNDTVALLQQNLEAQKNIITALTEANAQYAGTRQALAEKDTVLTEVLNSLRSAYGELEQLLLRGAQGVMFFRQLDARLVKLRRKVHEFCQQERRERLAHRKEEEPGSSALQRQLPSSDGMRNETSVRPNQSRQVHTAPPGLMPSRSSKPPPGLMPSRSSKPPHLSGDGVLTGAGGGSQLTMKSPPPGELQPVTSSGIPTQAQFQAGEPHTPLPPSLQQTSSLPDQSQSLPNPSEHPSLLPQVAGHQISLSSPDNLQYREGLQEPSSQLNHLEPQQFPGPAVPPAIAALAGRTGRASSSPELSRAHPTLPLDDPMAVFEPKTPSPSAVEALVSLLPAEVLEALPAEILADPNNFSLLAELVNVGTAVRSDHVGGDSEHTVSDSHVANMSIIPDSTTTVKLPLQHSPADKPETTQSDVDHKQASKGPETPSMSGAAEENAIDVRTSRQSTVGDISSTVELHLADKPVALPHSALDQLTAVESHDAQMGMMGQSPHANRPKGVSHTAGTATSVELSNTARAASPECGDTNTSAPTHSDAVSRLTDEECSTVGQSAKKSVVVDEADAVAANSVSKERTVEPSNGTDPTALPSELAKADGGELLDVNSSSSDVQDGKTGDDQSAVSHQLCKADLEEPTTTSGTPSALETSHLSAESSSESNLSIRDELSAPLHDQEPMTGADVNRTPSNNVAEERSSQLMQEDLKQDDSETRNVDMAGEDSIDALADAKVTVLPSLLTNTLCEDANELSSEVASYPPNVDDNDGNVADLEEPAGENQGKIGGNLETNLTSLPGAGLKSALEATDGVAEENLTNLMPQSVHDHTSSSGDELVTSMANKQDSSEGTANPKPTFNDAKDKGAAEQEIIEMTTDTPSGGLQQKEEGDAQATSTGSSAGAVYPSLSSTILPAPTTTDATKPPTAAPSSSSSDSASKFNAPFAPASKSLAGVITVSQVVKTSTPSTSVTPSMTTGRTPLSSSLLLSQTPSKSAGQQPSSSLSPAQLELIAQLKERKSQVVSQNIPTHHQPMSGKDSSNAPLLAKKSQEVQLLLDTQREQIAVQEQQMKSQAAAIAALQTQIKEQRQVEDRLRQQHQETIIANQQLQLAQQQQQLQALILQQQQEQKEKRERLQVATSLFQQRQQVAAEKQLQVQRLLLQQQQNQQFNQLQQHSSTDPVLQSIRSVVSSQSSGKHQSMAATAAQVHRQPMTPQPPLSTKPMQPLVQASQQAMQPLQSVNQQPLEPVSHQPQKPLQSVHHQPLQPLQPVSQQQASQLIQAVSQPPVQPLQPGSQQQPAQALQTVSQQQPAQPLQTVSQQPQQPFQGSRQQPAQPLLSGIQQPLQPLQPVNQQAAQLHQTTRQEPSGQPVGQQQPVQPLLPDQQLTQPLQTVSQQQPTQSLQLMNQHPLQPLQPVIQQQSGQLLQVVGQNPPQSVVHQLLQPVSQQPVQPISQRPLVPVGQSLTSKPVNQQLLQPFSQPLQPVRQVTQPVNQQPMSPVSQQPLQPISLQPLQPVSQQPLQHNSQQPLQPVGQQLLQPTSRHTLQSISQQSVQAVGRQLPQQVSQQPVQAVGQQPPQQVSQQSLQPVGQQPPQPASHQTLRSISQQPLLPADQEPQQPVRQQALQPIGQQPTQHIKQPPPQPVSQHPSQPVSIQSFNQQLVQSGERQPLQQVSQQVLQQTTQQPSQPGGPQLLQAVSQPAQLQSLRQEQLVQLDGQEQHQRFVEHKWQHDSQQPLSVHSQQPLGHNRQAVGQYQGQSLSQEMLPTGHRTSLPPVSQQQIPASSHQQLLRGQQLGSRQVNAPSQTAQFQPSVQSLHSVQSQSSGSIGSQQVPASSGGQPLSQSYSQKLPSGYSQGLLLQTTQQVNSSYHSPMRPLVQGPNVTQPFQQPFSPQPSAQGGGVAHVNVSSSSQRMHLPQSVPDPSHHLHGQASQRIVQAQPLPGQHGQFQSTYHPPAQHGGYLPRAPQPTAGQVVTSSQQSMHQLTAQQQSAPNQPHTQTYQP